MQDSIILQYIYSHGVDAIKFASNKLPDNFTLICTLIALVISYGLYYIIVTPIDRFRDFGESGFHYLEDEAKRRGRKVRDYANYIRSLQSTGKIPPVFPNGWIPLIESQFLRKGEVKTITAIGETFAVFRTKEGEACVLDAYCPHLGANLGAGGVLSGSCIECPFHGWLFDGKTGECVSVPYSDKVPPHSSVKKWKSIEQTGAIFIWYHAENEEPTWYPPVIKEIESGKWVYKGRIEHIVRSHFQDVPENGGDVAHLSFVHNPSLLAGVDLRNIRSTFWDFFAIHDWHGQWKEGEAPNAHTASVEITHRMKVFSKISLFSVDVNVLQIGPALVHLSMNFAAGDAVVIQTVTPLGPLEQRVVHSFYAPKYVPTIFCSLALIAEAIQVERDMMIWNHKKYMHKPILVKEDRFLARHRRWFSQFYSENSPTLASVRESLNW